MIDEDDRATLADNAERNNLVAIHSRSPSSKPYDYFLHVSSTHPLIGRIRYAKCEVARLKEYVGAIHDQNGWVHDKADAAQLLCVPP